MFLFYLKLFLNRFVYDCFVRSWTSYNTDTYEVPIKQSFFYQLAIQHFGMFCLCLAFANQLYVFATLPRKQVDEFAFDARPCTKLDRG